MAVCMAPWAPKHPTTEQGHPAGVEKTSILDLFGASSAAQLPSSPSHDSLSLSRPV